MTTSAKPSAERNRAARIRKRRASGNASQSDIDWLRSYEASRGKPGRPVASPALAYAPPAPASSNTVATAPPPIAPAAQARAQAETGYVPISFDGVVSGPPVAGALTSSAGMAPPGAPAFAGAPGYGVKCNIPDCPACKRQLDGAICQVTGKRVWPPMDIDAARKMAEGILWLVGMAIKFFRKDKFYVEPMPHEVEIFAKGIQLVQQRRASWLGAFDDIAMAFGGLAGYGTRAAKYPDQRKKLRPENPANDDGVSNANERR